MNETAEEKEKLLNSFEEKLDIVLKEIEQKKIQQV
jgi:hypothetical protein